MVNEGTNSTALTNTTTVAGSLTGLGTNATAFSNVPTATRTVDNIELPNVRSIFLWHEKTKPWELSEPWTYESVVKSNVEITNI
jgi:hypothetical protein